MKPIVTWLNHLFESLPLPLLEVWGRFSFLVGLGVMFAAFFGFTFRPGGYWSFGRQSQAWDSRALLSFILTFVFVVVSGYSGSSIVLVPHAQTFESLKDLSVFICIVLFGYPALLSVPIAYAVSDLIEGVPPSYIVDWFVGYLINPALFWLGYLYIGREPDFRKKKTWKGYLRFVLIFSFLEPILWGYLCTGNFTPENSYRKVVPALFFTTSVTWLLAPLLMFIAYPIAKKVGLFWADIPNHVIERSFKRPEEVWISGQGRWASDVLKKGVPIRMFIATPFIVLVLVMVGSTAYITLRNAESEATRLAGRLHQEMADTLNAQLDHYLASIDVVDSETLKAGLNQLLSQTGLVGQGRAFIIDQDGNVVATSGEPASDMVVVHSVRKLIQRHQRLDRLIAPSQHRLDIVTAQPLNRETWLAQATPYRDKNGVDRKWILMTAIPESFYLSGVRAGSSQSAMVFALFLTLSLVIASLLAKYVTQPIHHLACATDAIAQGKLNQYMPQSRLEEVNTLSKSFNHMTRQLCIAYDDLHAAKEQAELNSRQKSEFLDIAAHELRTPMTPMSLLIQMVQDEVEQGKPVPAKYVQQISKHLKRLISLVDELLNLSRLERGALRLSWNEVDLAAMLSEILDDFRRMVPARKFTGEGLKEPVPTELDSMRIHQVLHNLLDNALKYTPAGTPIEIRLSHSPADVEVAVIDHGRGVNTEEEPYLFDKFYRAKSEKDRQQGLGLGLYICRKIVELHGGKIFVKKTQPTGCTFQFALPRKKETAHA